MVFGTSMLNAYPMVRCKLGIIGLLQPARVLDILKNFMVFERTEGKIIKKVARYQQLRAANKITDRVINSNLKQGVIWHTQGSGKCLTMLYTSFKLRQSKELKDPFTWTNWWYIRRLQISKCSSGQQYWRFKIHHPQCSCGCIHYYNPKI